MNFIFSFMGEQEAEMANSPASVFRAEFQPESTKAMDPYNWAWPPAYVLASET